jgi:hypothetical protein
MLPVEIALLTIGIIIVVISCLTSISQNSRAVPTNEKFSNPTTFQGLASPPPGCSNSICIDNANDAQVACYSGDNLPPGGFVNFATCISDYNAAVAACKTCTLP